MRRVACVVGLFGVLAICAVAAAASLPNGTYTGTVGGSALGGKVKGTWTLAFASPNYTIGYNGSTVVKGSFSQSGGKVTFSDKSGKLACPGKGVYSYKVSGRTLTFKKVSDSSKCAGRIAVLAVPFTKKFASSPGGYTLLQR
jgi:hypothetical protein